MKYRNVVEIEAYQLSAGTREAIKSALGNFAWHSDSNGDEELYLYAEGGIRTECAREGDWIINHPLLGLSVMDADHFALTYVENLDAPFLNRPLRGGKIGASWTLIVEAGDCECGCGVSDCHGECGEDLICAGCGGCYSDCPCPGPSQDGVEYMERDGKTYGRDTEDDES